MDEQGLSQTQLAKLAGVNDAVLTRFLKDKRSLEGVNLYKIMVALKMIGHPEPYPYTDKSIHDIVEFVIVNGEQDTINAYVTAITGTYKRLKEASGMKGEVARLKEEIEELKELNNRILQRLQLSATRKTGSRS
jgi:transcriptional regulator with XRE-family HTH domain